MPLGQMFNERDPTSGMTGNEMPEQLLATPYPTVDDPPRTTIESAEVAITAK